MRDPLFVMVKSLSRSMRSLPSAIPLCAAGDRSRARFVCCRPQHALDTVDWTLLLCPPTGLLNPSSRLRVRCRLARENSEPQHLCQGVVVPPDMAGDAWRASVGTVCHTVELLPSVAWSPIVETTAGFSIRCVSLTRHPDQERELAAVLGYGCEQVRWKPSPVPDAESISLQNDVGALGACDLENFGSPHDTSKRTSSFSAEMQTFPSPSISLRCSMSVAWMLDISASEFLSR
jgi:hypothetical protein